MSSASTSLGPLLNDPCAWGLMMDWAEDKIRYGELDEKMQEYGSCYIHKEWKPLINEIFMQSDPGAEDAVPAPLVVHSAMGLQGISLTVMCAPAPAPAPAPPFGAMTLPWLPHQVYVEASCPLEVQQNLPPSCSQSHKEITLLPPQEGTLIMAFRAQQVLPTQSWVQIRKSRYKGDVGYIEESADSDAIIILIAPHQLPYDLPEESGESMRFDVELARIADLDLVPILSPSGTKIGYSCDGQQFVHGLFRLTLPAETLEIVELPHPNDIRFHMAVGIDPYFVKETLNLFLAQFWQEQDTVEI
ncbi:hypothetical protein EV401DRAFT_2082702 [Pisolithus croceorrhizus]|nr:hypothetical protein EV401DRAFT_2082702 [Pisolithus croceorrhizus]